MFCPNCGKEIADDAAVCPVCGATVNNETKAIDPSRQKANRTLRIIAKVFMIIGCVAVSFTLIPMCWAIPMTVHYSRAVKNSKPVGIGFKICSLLFVSTVAGILMLCDTERA